MRSREVNNSQMQNSRWFCRKWEPSTPSIQYRTWTNSFVLKIRRCTEGGRKIKVLDKNKIYFDQNYKSEKESYKKLTDILHKNWENWKRSQNCVWRNFLGENCESTLQSEIIVRSQSTCNYSESSWNASPRLLSATKYTEVLGYIRRRSWKFDGSTWIDLWNFFWDASSNKIRWLGIRRCWNNWNQRLRSGKRHETNSEIFKKVVHWESFVAHRKGFIHEWLRNKDSNCRSCILTKFPIPSTFSSWKTSFKTEVCACPGSPSEAILWSKKWRWLVHWNTSNHHARFRGKISRIRDARCEDCIRTEQDHPEPLPQEEGESGRAESSNARSISSRTTDRLPSWFTSISEQLAFMILFSTVQIYSASLSEVTMCRNSCNMGRHVLPMSKIPPDDVLESLYKLRIHESNQLKAVFELYDLGSHQKNSKLDYQKWKTMVKRSIALNIRPQIYHARNVRMETGAAAKSHMLSVESERTVFKRRQWQVPSPLQ